MKVGFVTCVELGLSCMEAIYEVGGELHLIVTLKDDVAVKKSGRVYIDEFAATHRIPVLKVDHINDPEALERIGELDWLFIIGWSQIAGPNVLRAPRFGAIGMHPTLLPEGRGRASIPWAILKGLAKTGVTMFKLDEGIDTGPILRQQEIELTADITATKLYALVDQAHIDLMKSIWPVLVGGSVRFERQDEARATIWPGRRPDDGRIDESGSVWDAEKLVRAVTRPYPGAFIEREGRKIVVWTAKVSDDHPAGPFVQFYDGYLELLEMEEKETR